MELDSVGTYTASLTVTDLSGVTGSASIKVVSSNEPPRVSVALNGNQSFYFLNRPIGYAVDVKDREDGSLADGGVEDGNVHLSFDYVASDFDLDTLPSGESGDDIAGSFGEKDCHRRGAFGDRCRYR
ncbi:MAG: hypothetical protein M2R45_04338 [Verrucomicrobia subdivision 3 bacterium]|nr:hypothetical protein [Limisphaerales bacterium]MCS1416042.1 hypothetical protein [Limisphaerales bacterium]